MQVAAVQKCKLQPAFVRPFMALSVPFYTHKCFRSATPSMSSWQQPMLLLGSGVDFCQVFFYFLFSVSFLLPGAHTVELLCNSS